MNLRYITQRKERFFAEQDLVACLNQAGLDVLDVLGDKKLDGPTVAKLFKRIADGLKDAQ